MNNHKSWHMTILLMLPGLLVAAQNIQVFGLAFPFIAVIILVMLIMTDIYLYKKQGTYYVICLISALGAFLWEGYQLLLMMYTTNVALIVFEIILSTATLICVLLFLYDMYKKRHMRIFFIISAFFIILTISTRIPINLFQISSLILAKWIIRGLPILALAFMTTRRFGIKQGGLLIIVYIPFLVHLYLLPLGIEYEVRKSSSLFVQASLLIFRLLPSLSFLMISPLFAMFVKKDKYINIFFLFISFLSISILSFLRVNTLSSSGTVYILPPSIMWIYFTSLVWSPLVLFYFLLRKYPKTNRSTSIHAS